MVFDLVSKDGMGMGLGEKRIQRSLWREKKTIKITVFREVTNITVVTVLLGTY